MSYQRCSTDDQAEGAFSTTVAQEKLNREHIETRIATDGGTFVGSYTDDGVSGTKVSRPELNRLMEDARARKFDVVVVTFMSRLGRGEAYTIIEHNLSRLGIDVETVRESFGEGVGGYVARRVTNLMDGMYPVMVSGWVRTKKAAMVQVGYWPGGRIPFGCKTEPVPEIPVTVDKYGHPVAPPRRLVADPETMPIVIEGFETFLRTKSLAATVRHFQSAAPDAMFWNIDRVMTLLTRETYIGVLSYGENRNETAFEPLIPREVFDRTQTVLASLREESVRSDGYQVTERYDPNAYYLRGRVYCRACGRVMTPKASKGKTSIVGYYECTASTKSEGRCPVQRVNAATLHRVVLTEVVRAAKHPSRLELFVRETTRILLASSGARGAKEEVRRLRALEAKHNKALSRLSRAIREGGTVRTLVADIRAVETDLAKTVSARETAEQLAAAEDGQRPDVALISMLWQEMIPLVECGSETERTNIYQGLVQEIEITEKGAGVLRLRLDAISASAPSHVRNSEGGYSRKSSNFELSGGKTFPPFCEIPITIPKGGSRLPKIKPATRPVPPYHREEQDVRQQHD